METAGFDYLLPPEQVAADPAEARDGSRLMVLDRAAGTRKHARFLDLLEYLPPAALLVLNDTRVFPARLRGHKTSGGAVEFLATRRISSQPAEAGCFAERWEGLTRGLAGREVGAIVPYQGLVQSKGLAKLQVLRLRCVRAEDGARDVAGDERRQQEGHRRHDHQERE